MTNRVPLDANQLNALNIYSQLHESLVEILIEHSTTMSEEARFAIEDALLNALKPNDSRTEFVELSMLSSGAPRLIRAIEREWAYSRVFIDPYQNPESLGVSLSMIIHKEMIDYPSIANDILDSDAKVKDPLLTD